jgi:predicted nuclease with TOPRIM domain
MGCFTDQVKLTRALVQNLDKDIKEVKLLGEHGEESSRKITELEALCERLRDDTQRLEEEKATLEEMVESRDELLMEKKRKWTTKEILPHPLPLDHHPRRPLLTYQRRSMKKALWKQSQSKKI